MIYKHLFFDLDRTIWDFEQNKLETMEFLYMEFLSGKLKCKFSSFIDTFDIVHEVLWEKYRNGKINKENLRKNRFYLTLKKLGADDMALASQLNTNYLKICPAKNNLFPYTIETLDYLYKKYNLYILTNGFLNTQKRKLNNSGLDKYFQRIFSSEEIGYNKPHKKIFAWAVNSLNAKKSECLMIGDDPDVDIKGAAKYGIGQVFFNPRHRNVPVTSTFQINSLKELTQLF